MQRAETFTAKLLRDGNKRGFDFYIIYGLDNILQSYSHFHEALSTQITETCLDRFADPGASENIFPNEKKNHKIITFGIQYDTINYICSLCIYVFICVYGEYG